MHYPASLRSDRWPSCHGLGGRLRLDCVVAFTPESVVVFAGICNERVLRANSYLGAELLRSHWRLLVSSSLDARRCT